MQHVKLSEVRHRFSTEGAEFSTGIQRDFGDTAYYDVPLIGRVYLLYHPKNVHEVLVRQADHLEKPAFLRMVLKSSFGNGLFNSSGTLWKTQRKLIQPAFHHVHIAQYAERMRLLTQQHLQTWRAGETLKIDTEMHALTLTIVVDALFSADVRGQAAEIGQAMHDLGQAIAMQGNNLAAAFAPEWLPIPSLQRKQRAVKTLNRIVRTLAQERRALGEANSPHDLLSALVFAKDADTGEQMNDQQLRDELVTLFIAGHETTAWLLSWAWSLLAQYPETEAKLHAELDTVLNGQPPTLADLARLPYTSQVIKETLRLYPPAWFVMRQATMPIQIDDVSLSKGNVIFVFPYATQRDTRWFADAERFMPERWSNDFEKSLPKGAYFPFGMGPRVCIGNGFAMMEAQLILATIAQRYRLELCEQPIPTKGAGTLGFEQPVTVRLHAR
jgi:cytochrome P450